MPPRQVAESREAQSVGQECCERMTYPLVGGAETVIAENCAHDGVEKEKDDVEVCPGLVVRRGSGSFVERVVVEFHLWRSKDWATVDES